MSVLRERERQRERERRNENLMLGPIEDSVVGGVPELRRGKEAVGDTDEAVRGRSAGSMMEILCL